MASLVCFLFVLSCLAIFQVRCEPSKDRIQSACELARYRRFCRSILVQNVHTGPKELSETAMNVSKYHSQRASELIPPERWVSRAFGPKQSRAMEECRVMLDLALIDLEKSLSKLNKSPGNSLNWKSALEIQSSLSAALTNQATCLERLQEANVSLRQFTFTSYVVNASRSASTSLALIKKFWIQGKSPQWTSLRSLRQSQHGSVNDGFPWWISRADKRRLVQSTDNKDTADATVAADGSGQYKTVTQAVNAAPANSDKKFVIYVKAGVYKENVNVPASKPNIMLIGDGKDQTVITGSRNMNDWALPDTATFGVYGEGFHARDITFENTVDTAQLQAVALTVAAGKAAFYRCALKGYQDTLFAFSSTQFYRECDIYGTVDFVCGNAAAVFQNCNLIVRKPADQTLTVVTAQNRRDPNENSGFSFQNCKVTAAPGAGSLQTYLGRPWGKYSRTVFMESSLDNIIDPAGWLGWKGYEETPTLYYGEYQNTGPGAGTANRVKWPGYHVMKTADANEFTVTNLISGDDWLQSQSVPFDAGLN